MYTYAWLNVKSWDTKHKQFIGDKEKAIQSKIDSVVSENRLNNAALTHSPRWQQEQTCLLYRSSSPSRTQVRLVNDGKLGQMVQNVHSCHKHYWWQAEESHGALPSRSSHTRNIRDHTRHRRWFRHCSDKAKCYFSQKRTSIMKSSNSDKLSKHLEKQSPSMLPDWGN